MVTSYACHGGILGSGPSWLSQLMVLSSLKMPKCSTRILKLLSVFIQSALPIASEILIVIESCRFIFISLPSELLYATGRNLLSSSIECYDNFLHFSVAISADY